jgi:hypothetical protein
MLTCKTKKQIWSPWAGRSKDHQAQVLGRVETSGNHWPVDRESLHCSRKQDDVGWRCLNSGQNKIATFSSNETRGETPWFHSGMQLRTPMWYSSGGWGLQVNWYNRTKLYIPAPTSAGLEPWRKHCQMQAEIPAVSNHGGSRDGW